MADGSLHRASSYAVEHMSESETKSGRGNGGVLKGEESVVEGNDDGGHILACFSRYSWLYVYFDTEGM